VHLVVKIHLVGLAHENLIAHLFSKTWLIFDSKLFSWVGFSLPKILELDTFEVRIKFNFWVNGGCLIIKYMGR
jgi:hypothetical protein